MVERTIEEFGRIDILINNAASARGPDRVPIPDLTLDNFQTVIHVKVTGTFLCTKAVIDHMVASGRRRQDSQRGLRRRQDRSG